MTYLELITNPPKLEVVKNPRELIIKTVSCMCDNVHYLTLKKNGDSDFKMSGNGYSLSNWQFKHPVHDIEWAADSHSWTEVFKMINSGTAKIESVKSR